MLSASLIRPNLEYPERQQMPIAELSFLQNNVTIVTTQDSYLIISCLRVTIGAFSIVT